MNQEKKRRMGRPRGREQTVVINIRVPLSLQDRLDAYIRHRESEEPESLSRGAVVRELLEQLLEEEGF